MFNHLFSQLTIGNITLPNRICFLAHRTNFAKKGRLHDRHIAYYRRRAQGGCGLIIVGEISIHPGDYPWENMIEVYREGAIEDFLRLTQAIHEFDTAVFAQLCHHGFQSSGAITRQAVLGPSAVSDVVFGEKAKAMEKEDIEETVQAFARAAETVMESGFDGLEIDMGPESLLRQFLSPLSNHRPDEFGGDIENRMRLPLEVIDRIRRAVGRDFTVGIRLCVDEKFWGAITIDESKQFVERFENTGQVDVINVSVGTYYNLHLQQASMHTPFGFTLDLAGQTKKCTRLPVIAGHQIESPEMAENILAHGQADAVGLVRNLICDPDAPLKAREGRDDDIRYCIRDNEGCIGRTNRSRSLSCTLNPEVGFEERGTQSAARGRKDIPLSKDSKSKIPKRVVVIGAGPAGLEAARAAHERGHDVTLYEREEDVGGQINLAKMGAGREMLWKAIRCQAYALEKCKVPVIKGVDVTHEMVLGLNPDAVIVATGSRPRLKPVPGDYGPPHVLNVWEILKDRYSVGERILYIDENGGHRASATAERLADQGKRVDMVTSELFIGIDLAPIRDLHLSRQRLLQKGVTFTCDIRIDGIDVNRVRGRHIYTNEPLVYDNYDTVVLDMGNAVEDRLYKQLKGNVKEIRRVGDCVAPRNIAMAVFEGWRAGVTL